MDAETHDHDFEAPSIEVLQPLFPAYEIEGFIAQGGMGAVYMARQNSLDRPVAIKILPPEFGGNPQFRASFEAEAKAMAKLNHPNLIGVYDFGDVEGMLFIIMEFVKGKSLYHSAYGKAVEQSEAARIVSAICRGLAHAHNAGILHRDIKPANILLAPGAVPKIGDFGLARAVGEGHGPDEIVYGTPGYSAPEVVNHPDAVDQRTDIFAVGVLLYELLTGKLPAEPWQPPSTVSGCSNAYDSIVRRATHPSPGMRYPKVEEIADALDELASKPAATLTAAPAPSAGARPITPARPVLASSSKSKAGPVIITILVVAVIAIGALVLNKGDKPPETPSPADTAGSSEVAPETTPEKPKRVVDRDKPKREKPKREKPAPVEPEPADPEPVRESVTQALARLQPALRKGDLSELPEGTAKRGSAHFLLVEKTRNWAAAARFAEEHGAHLAVLEGTEDLAWVTAQFKAPAPLWLGLSDSGTEGKWHWMNGESPVDGLWAPGQPSDTPTKDGEDFAALLPGTDQLDDLAGSRELPFLLQWNEEDQRGRVASQLARTAADLKARRSPVFPAGTRNVGGSRFLLVAGNISWEEASAQATTAGGHLAVPSNAAEALWITDTLRAILTDGEGCWIGGRRSAQRWEFVTGERFQFVEWAPGSPLELEATQQGLELKRSSDGETFGFTNRASTEAVRYHLLEWSVPSRRNMPKAGEENAPADAAAWLLAHRQQTSKNHKVEYERFQRRWDKNVQDFVDDIESEADTARRANMKALERIVDAFIDAIEEQGEIPAELDNEFAKRMIGGVHGRALAKQQKLWDDYQAEFELARTLYLDTVKERAAALLGQGDRDGASLLEREHTATSNDEKRFLAILRGEFPEVPEAETEEGDDEDDDE